MNESNSQKSDFVLLAAMGLSMITSIVALALFRNLTGAAIVTGSWTAVCAVGLIVGRNMRWLFVIFFLAAAAMTAVLTILAVSA